MRMTRPLSILLIALLAACSSTSGASSGPSTNGNPSQAGQASAGEQPGGLDCEALTTAAAQLIMLQFLAQLRDADSVEAVKTKQIGNLDLDVFLAAMHTLHALDSHPSVLGDPKPAIDFYEKAGRAAKDLFAADPLTQAAIDAYNENVGTVTEFLSHQTAISAAIGEAGC